MKMISRFLVRLLLFSVKAVTAGVVVWTFLSGQAFGEGSWLDKGSELMKGLQQTSPAKSGLPSSTALSSEEIGSGLKEALRVGSESVVSRLGKTDGFNSDAAIRILLPDELNKVKTALAKVGMSAQMDDLEVRLNRAAEAATPKAKALFLDSISKMTINDVQAIYKGPDDAATQYFRKNMSPGLSEEMKPIVDSSLAEAGAIQAYDKVMGQYRSMPFVPDVKANLSKHVVTKGMDGIFHYMGKEEAAIRKDPAKRTTDILKKVFQ